MGKYLAAVMAVIVAASVAFGAELMDILTSRPAATTPLGVNDKLLVNQGGQLKQVAPSGLGVPAHKSTHAIGGADPLNPADIGAAVYPNPGIPYSIGNGWGLPFTPSNKIPANYVALPQLPQDQPPCGNGRHIDSYDAATGQFTCSADASIAGANDANAVHVNAAGEIAGVTAKATPAGADLMMIESAADGNTKRAARIDSLPFQPPGSYLTPSAIGVTVQAHTSALDAVSGTNTGDETQSSIKTKLGAAGPGDGYLTAAQYVTLSTALQQSSTLDATKLSGTATVNTTGNAGTATKLAAPRAINGVNFDGSAPITITAAPTAHNQDASTITTGTLDGDRLPAMSTTKKGAVPATSTPSGKFLKDDGTWATVTGGGSTPLSGASAYPATGDVTAITPGYFDAALTAGITTPVVISSAADGEHFTQPYNTSTCPTICNGGSCEGALCTLADGNTYQYHIDRWWLKGGAGTVTQITASAPLTGGTITGSGTIGIPQATSSTSGYLASGDWSTFNSKQAALVSGTNIKTVAGISLLGSGDIGTIPTSKGGTGATDFSFSGTAHQVASVTGTKTLNKQLTFDGSGNVIASIYDVGAAGGGGGSGTVANSSNAYRLAGYAASGTTVSDTGITYATDGSSLSTVQSAIAADALGLRAQSSYGTNQVSVSVVNGPITTWAFLFPGTQPADGCLNLSGGVLGSTGSPCGSGSGITALTGDVTASGTGSVAATVISASTTQAGKVQLTDSVSSTSTSTAATPNSVKQAYDLAATKGTGTVTAVSVASANGVSGSSSGGTTPALTISLGAITPTSVAATGLIDGTAPTVLTTTSSYTLGSTYKTNYTYNNHATAAQAITYTLPTAAAGRTECVMNYIGKTGALRVNTSAAGQYIVKKGVLSASGGYVVSGGALGDGACFVGADATHWVMYLNDGTWTLN